MYTCLYTAQLLFKWWAFFFDNKNKGWQSWAAFAHSTFLTGFHQQCWCAQEWQVRAQKEKKNKKHLCNSFPKLGQHEIMCSKETVGADNALCTAKWWFNFKTFARSYLLHCNSIRFSKHRHTPCCTTLFGLLACYSDFKFFSTQLSHPISWSLLHGLLDTMLSLLYAETKECCLIAKKKPMYKTERKTEKARSMVQERHLASSRNNILHVHRHIHASHP